MLYMLYSLEDKLRAVEDKIKKDNLNIRYIANQKKPRKKKVYIYISRRVSNKINIVN